LVNSILSLERTGTDCNKFSIDSNGFRRYTIILYKVRQYQPQLILGILSATNDKKENK